MDDFVRGDVTIRVVLRVYRVLRVCGRMLRDVFPIGNRDLNGNRKLHSTLIISFAYAVARRPRRRLCFESENIVFGFLLLLLFSESCHENDDSTRRVIGFETLKKTKQNKKTPLNGVWYQNRDFARAHDSGRPRRESRNIRREELYVFANYYLIDMVLKLLKIEENYENQLKT